MEEKGILVEHVFKSFGKEKVLKDVSLVIKPGQIYGIVGNIGAAMITSMKMTEAARQFL